MKVSISHSVYSLRSIRGTGMVAGAGFEPASTAYEAVKGTTPLPRNMADPAGLEPATI